MSQSPNKLKPISEINTDELLEVTTYYHRFYDDEEDGLVNAIRNLQVMWGRNDTKPHLDEFLEKDVDVIFPFWDENAYDFGINSQKISKAIATIPQVVMDIRKGLYPFEQVDSLISIPQTPEPQPKKNMFDIKNPFKKNTHDPNSPYRLSNKKTKYLEKVEEKWGLINEYQTKGVSTWSRLILNVHGQMGYRDIILDFFNYFIAPSISSVFHYANWLNLAEEKSLSKDVLMTGMQQTIRKDEANTMQPSLPQV